MLRNYFKVAFRNIKRNKIFSLINIVGFAFSLAVCLMIVLYLLNEYSFDNYHANAENIYRLSDAKDNYSSIDYRVAKIITDNFPQVEKATIVDIFSPIETNYKSSAYYFEGLMSTDNNFFEMFTVRFLYGNSKKPFENINSAVLTESTSRKLFGNENPLGKEILIHHQSAVIVTGVIEDFPENSSLKAGIIVNAENNNFKFKFTCEDCDDVSSHRYPFNIYLQLNKNTAPGELTSVINNNAEVLAPFVNKVNLIPLKELYLTDYTIGDASLKGNPTLLNLMAGIALIILLLAIINYINLTAARQNKRNKETGIRKTVGASRKEMILLFLTESVLVTAFAFFIALLIVELALPFFSKIVDSSLSTRLFLIFPLNVILLCSVLLTGILAGIIPAVILSSFNPARILRGGYFLPRRKSYLRNTLTVFQFAVSIGLIFCITVIQKQIGFVKNQNPGFKKEQLLSVKFPFIAEKDRNKAPLMLDKLKQSPGIKSLTLSGGVPGDVWVSMGAGIKDKEQFLSIIFADLSFLETFGIKQIKGRELLPGDYGNVCMINETAYKYFGWNDLENKRFNNGRPAGYEVIGVVKDFNYSSLHYSIEPMCIIFKFQTPSNITIRIDEKAVNSTMENINKIWEEILPDYPLKYRFYDEWFDTMYRKEEKLANTVGLFALLAISISCLGILGLAIFSSESRTKEIGIRKVLGASVIGVVGMLTKDFTRWILLANIIAWPIAWYAMNKWLQNFAYRIDLTIWPFLLSALLALVIALLTVSWQAIKAATANPIESLRYE